MAAISPITGSGAGVVGVLDVRGEILPVVDPRPLLGLPTAQPHPDQQLVLVAHATRFVLWLDAVDQITHAPLSALPGAGGSSRSLADQGVKLDGRVVPVLSLDVLDPGLAAVANEPVP
jgi:chemotaxis signal transduction protein